MMLPIMLNVLKKSVGKITSVKQEEDCLNVIDHSSRDKNSHILKHRIKNKYKLPFLENFMILGTNCKKNKFWKKNFRVTVCQGKTLIIKHSRKNAQRKTHQGKTPIIKDSRKIYSSKTVLLSQ